MSAPTMPPPPSTGGPRALPRVTGAPKSSRLRLGGAAAVARSSLAGALLGYVAIVGGWAVTEAAGIADGRSLGPIAVYTAVLGAIYGLVVSSWADVAARIWDRAVVRAATGAAVGGLTGAMAGALSQVLFDALQKANDPGALRFYLLRALTWAVFGAGIGISGGIAERSMRKAVNGLFGGLLGGAVGGAIFHWVSQHVEAASQARLLSLAAIGLTIGGAIGVVEIARRQAWLRVLAGGMSGKEFILYHATTHIGSSPKCQITLIKDQSAQPFHVRIDGQGGRRVLTATDGAPTTVNGDSVHTRALRSGDRIQVGATTLEYLERAGA